MLQHFWQSWKTNRGNLLLTLGFLAGILMCFVWYFELLPEIQFRSQSVPGTLVSKQQRPEISPLVVTLRGVRPKQPEEGTDAGEAPLPTYGVVEIHTALGILEADVPPLFARSFEFETQRPTAVVFHELGAGEFAVLAYIDVNHNGKLDFDAESRRAVEPLRMSGATNHAPAKLDLEAARVTIVPNSTLLVEFDFGQRPRSQASGQTK